MKIIVLFNLKPGVSIDDYEAFATREDLPTVNALKSIANFEVYRTAGLLGADSAAPYQYIEILDVGDMDVFNADIATSKMQAIAGKFQGFAEDPKFIMTEKLSAS